MDSGTWLCLGVGVLIVGAIAVQAAVNTPRRCGVCGLQIKRTTHHWTIEGKSVRLCSRCNTRLANRKSKEGIEKLFGK